MPHVLSALLPHLAGRAAAVDGDGVALEVESSDVDEAEGLGGLCPGLARVFREPIRRRAHDIHQCIANDVNLRSIKH